MFRWAHVDEVNDYQATKVANTQLASDLVGGFEVGVQSSGFDVSALGCAGRVDVDRYERFGVIDDNAATRRQVYVVSKSRLDLRLDLESSEQRDGIDVMFQLLEIVRHCLLDMLVRVLVGRLVVDQDLADLIGQVIAQRTDDRIALAVNQKR